MVLTRLASLIFSLLVDPEDQTELPQYKIVSEHGVTVKVFVMNETVP